jgi:hypothetical protein
MQLAQIQNPALDSGLQEIRGDEFLSRIIPMLVTLTLIIGTVIFVFMLLMGAVAWITSGGDKAQVESSRSRITHALVGIVILFGVFAIVKVVEGLFGLSILSINLSSLSVSQIKP